MSLCCQSCAEWRIECPRGYFVLRLRCDVCGHRAVSAVAACRWMDLDPCACGGSWSEEADESEEADDGNR